MCRYPTILLLLLAVSVRAQFMDDFSDGDFTSDPTWSGDDGLFVVDAGRLRSNSAGAATYQLGTPNVVVDDVRWEWFVDLRFATSGANYVDHHLMADQADAAVSNGYFLRMGGTADRLELFRNDGGTAISTGLRSADGIVNSSSANPFRILVERTADGTFTLFHDDGNTGTYASVGPVTDATHTTTAHFIVRVVQSSAAGAVNNHFFDDFVVGPIPVDDVPPQVVSVVAVSATAVDLRFSEALDPASAQVAANYGIEPGITVSTAALDGADPALVHLTIAGPLVSGQPYVLHVHEVADVAGNSITEHGPFDLLHLELAVPVPGDVVINEIMADPSPVVQLPDAEYVELFNTTTDKYFDLAGWRLTTLTTQATIPAHVLAPGQFVVFVNQAQLVAFSDVPQALGWSLSNTALLNGGTTLTLEAAGGSVVDQVTYSSTWYGDDLKDDGGWSLERIAPHAPCSDARNWTASNDERGGTPGVVNSVFDDTPDTQAPLLVAVLVAAPTQVDLVFDEGLAATSVDMATFAWEPALVTTGVQLIGAGNDRVRITLAEPLEAGVFHTVRVEGLQDCSGNAAGVVEGSFAVPQPIAPLDLVINEVLYDPIGTGSDYVELFNRSAKVLSLGGLQLANESNGVIANQRLITAEPVVLVPGAYILLATNIADIAARYPAGRPERFLQMTLPGYNNGSGTVVLLDAEGQVIDLFRYSDAMHFELLNDTEGTSLERVDPERPTADITNWHSAAQDIGGGTPGALNSQWAPAPEPRGELTIEPAIFSPDNDGHQDLLTIAYRFDAPGFVATLKVFDVAGREVRTLWNNELLGTRGAVSWDGMMDTGQLARVGPYVVFLEAYDPEGRMERFRRTVVLAQRLH